MQAARRIEVLVSRCRSQPFASTSIMTSAAGDWGVKHAACLIGDGFGGLGTPRILGGPGTLLIFPTVAASIAVPGKKKKRVRNKEYF